MQRNIVIKTNKEAEVSAEELYDLFGQAFQAWRDSGLNAPFTYKTLEEFKAVIERANVFVAQDEAAGELLGMHCFYSYKNKSVFDFFLAVSPKAQRQGIATKLLQEEVERLKQRGYRYMKCTTSAGAPWSVRWHLKNGYHIVGYSRSERNNYASYIFRKQIATDVRHHPTDLLWTRPLAPVTAKIRYCLTWLATMICKDNSGRLNAIGRIAKDVRSKMNSQRNATLSKRERHTLT